MLTATQPKFLLPTVATLRVPDVGGDDLAGVGVGEVREDGLSGRRVVVGDVRERHVGVATPGVGLEAEAAGDLESCIRGCVEQIGHSVSAQDADEFQLKCIR